MTRTVVLNLQAADSPAVQQRAASAARRWFGRSAHSTALQFRRQLSGANVVPTQLEIELKKWGEGAAPQDQLALAQLMGTPVPSPAPSPAGRRLLAAAATGPVPAGLAEWYTNASAEQKQQLALLGFADLASLQAATPEQLHQLGFPGAAAQVKISELGVTGKRGLLAASAVPTVPAGLEAWLQTATPEQLQQMAQLGLTSPAPAQSTPTLQDMGGQARKLLSGDSSDGQGKGELKDNLKQWATTDTEKAQLQQLGVGSKTEAHPTVTLQDVAGDRTTATATATVSVAATASGAATATTATTTPTTQGASVAKSGTAAPAGTSGASNNTTVPK